MIPLILQAGAGEAPLDIISLMLNASPVVKGVLGAADPDVGGFVVRHRIEVSVPVERRLALDEVPGRFWKTGRLDEIWRISESSAPSPVGEVFRAGYTELAKLQKRRQERRRHGGRGAAR